MTENNQIVSKQTVTDYIKACGGTCSYSGNTKTMYINDPDKNNIDLVSIEFSVLNRFGYDLPFKLATN